MECVRLPKPQGAPCTINQHAILTPVALASESISGWNEVNEMPDDTDLLVIIRSAVGFSSEILSLQDWSKKPQVDRSFRISMMVWSEKVLYGGHDPESF